jgi:hypothetical protein
MIVSECFPNDSLRIARIQSSFYWSALSIILTEVKDRYRTAAVIVGVNTELLKRVNSEGLKDHRPLQWLHDAFAAKFRYEYVHEPDLFTRVRHTLLNNPIQVTETQAKSVDFRVSL